MKLFDLLNESKLYEHINNRVINVQHHRYAPLVIYNYGQKAQFDGIWDDVTCLTRGLIVDQSTNDIVARPFRKFFNLNTAWWPETMEENLPPEMPEITEKLDGSLGVLYRANGLTAIATRGSFESDQAAWASTWYGKFMNKAEWPEGWTPLFEIVYPDNRIVVKYEWEGLSLLSLVNIDTGAEMAYSNVEAIANHNRCRVVRRVHSSIKECKAENRENEEGYVLTWTKPQSPALKIKVKFVDYCRLHRLLTSISPKRIWEMLKDGIPFDELFDNTPSHYQDWVSYWKNGLQADFGRIEQKAQAVFASCTLPKDGADKIARKALAEFFTLGDRKSVSGVLFKMLDGQSYDEIIWKLLRDKVREQDPFRREE